MKKDINNFSSSFNQDFCTDLEFQLSIALRKSNHKIFKYFWCDGVKSAPFVSDQDNYDYLSTESVCSRKMIKTDAWFGESGQDNYEMKILLGNKALKLYQNGENLKGALPNTENIEWIEVDTRKRQIKIHLE